MSEQDDQQGAEAMDESKLPVDPLQQSDQPDVERIDLTGHRGGPLR